jgi:hypothetical protein
VHVSVCANLSACALLLVLHAGVATRYDVAEIDAMDELDPYRVRQGLPPAAPRCPLLPCVARPPPPAPHALLPAAVLLRIYWKHTGQARRHAQTAHCSARHAGHDAAGVAGAHDGPAHQPPAVILAAGRHSRQELGV